MAVTYSDALSTDKDRVRKLIAEDIPEPLRPVTIISCGIISLCQLLQ